MHRLLMLLRRGEMWTVEQEERRIFSENLSQLITVVVLTGNVIEMQQVKTEAEELEKNQNEM